MNGPPLPEAPGWDTLHQSLADVRWLSTQLAIRMRALAVVWEEIGSYGGTSEFEKGKALAYTQAAKEIRLILGDEE